MVNKNDAFCFVNDAEKREARGSQSEADEALLFYYRRSAMMTELYDAIKHLDENYNIPSQQRLLERALELMAE